MKVFLLVLAALCLAVSAMPMDTCNTYSCSSVGQTCVATNMTTYKCIGNTYCNNTVCVALPAIGQQCAFSACTTGAVCGNNNTCVSSGKANGASCGVSAECASLLCSTGVCAVKNIGDACALDQNCAGDFVYCDIGGSGLCTAAAAVNSACSLSSTDINVCAGPYICMTNSTTLSTSTGVCAAPFQAAAGARCRRTRECADGLTCSGGNSTFLGTCATAQTFVGAVCDTVANCSSGYGCLCSPTTGQTTCIALAAGTQPGSKSAANSLVSCVTKKCSTLTAVCITSNCAYETCTLANLAQSQTRQFPYPTCYANDKYPIATCKKESSSTSDASALVASVSVAVVAALAALL